MREMDELLTRVAAREQDPAWQDRMRREDEAAKKRADRAHENAKRALIAKIGLPGKDLSLMQADGPRPTAATAALSGPVVLTVLSGGTGTGKTTAAAAWLYSFAVDPENWRDLEGKPGTIFGPGAPGCLLFFTAARLARVSRYSEEEMRSLLRARRLVIDDLGAEYLDEKGAYLSLLDEVVNERYAERLPTVLTTNLQADAFKARYGERIRDRIREAGRFVSLGETSMRGRPQRAPAPPSGDSRLPREQDEDEPQREIVP